MTRTTPTKNDGTARLCVGMDLGGKTWKLAFSDGRKFRFKTIEAWDLKQLVEEVEAAKQKLGAAAGCEVCSCHEAGRDGFSVHRALERLKLRSLVVDSSSIEVDRRKRRLKTDRLDAKKLVRQLYRYLDGDTDALRVVRVPSLDKEDERRPSRERERLQKEIYGHKNRIRSLLVTQGIADKLARDVVAQLEALELPPKLKAELLREARRLALAVTVHSVAALARPRLSRRCFPDYFDHLRRGIDSGIAMCCS